MILLWVWLGCSTPSDAPDPAQVPADAAAPLDPVALLVRASLDLRGVRPSLQELRAVAADPASVDGLIDGFFDDPRFPGRVREVFDEVFQIRDEEPFVPVETFGLPWSDTALWEAIGEEPTRMIERITAEDLPYTELVTADWTMGNEVLKELFLIDYPDGETGWRPVHYTDGRPAAGVLVSNGLWWQVGSMLNNLNRGRANKLSSVLLCFNYLNSEIDFTAVNVASSDDALGDAIRTDPACTACHDTLDPLASTLYGFWFPSVGKDDLFGVRPYHFEDELLWRRLGGLPPAFRGEAVAGVEELGARIAAAPDYGQCLARHALEGLLRRPAAPDDAPVLDAAYGAYVAQGQTVRAVWRAIVRSAAYRAGSGDDAPRMVSPAVLASEIEDLTGFRWREAGWDLLRAPVRGYSSLLGGVDGITRNVGIDEPSVTTVAVQAQVAAMAARVVAEDDLRDPARARLLTGVDGSEVRDGGAKEARIVQQLLDLHLRLHGEQLSADDPDVADELALWGEAYAIASEPQTAWTAVLTVLLRHPNLVSY